jgi:hypothetical protein
VAWYVGSLFTDSDWAEIKPTVVFRPACESAERFSEDRPKLAFRITTLRPRIRF